MDPNETLRRLREALVIYDFADNDNDKLDAADTIVEAARDLDQWVSNGGFLPEKWDKA